MLENSKESLKLEAMKRIVGVGHSGRPRSHIKIIFKMTTSVWCFILHFHLSYQLIAKGKNASELFPAVVKNVASKNIEVRKDLKHLTCSKLHTTCKNVLNQFSSSSLLWFDLKVKIVRQLWGPLWTGGYFWSGIWQGSPCWWRMNV